MASFSSDGSVRCWICMRNGENRFFNGHAARKVHEETVHAPRYSQDNNGNTDASYRWYTKGYASRTTNINGYHSSNSATPTKLGKACFNQLETLRRKLYFQHERTADTPEGLHLAKIDQWLENGPDVREYEIKSLNTRFKKAQDEINARKEVIKKLQADLDNAQMTLTESQVKGTQLQEKLEAAKRQLKKATNELHLALGAIEHEREQRIQMQQSMESLVKSQKLQIIKLREELDNEKLMSKEKKNEYEELIMIKRKMKQLEQELMVEKRLKLEVKQSKEECQAEIDELLLENEEIKKKLRKYHHDLERLHDENRSLVSDYNSMMDRGEVIEAEQQLNLMQELMEEKFQEVRADFVNEIERYQIEAKEFKQKFEQTAAELEKAQSELEAVVMYRQDDIDRLLKEKQALKVDLKSKKGKLQCLEALNGELKSNLKEKESQLSQFQSFSSYKESNGQLDASETPVLEKCKEIEQLHIKVEELQDINPDEKTLKLKEELNQLKKDQLVKKGEFEDLNKKNEELRQLLKELQGKLLHEELSHEENVKSTKEQERKLETSLAEFEQENISLKRKLTDAEVQAQAYSKQLLDMEEKHRELTEKVDNSIERERFQSVMDQLDNQSSKIEGLLKEKENLQTSFKEEQEDLNEKLDKVLDANVDLEKSCIDLESILEQKNATIKTLETSWKEIQENTKVTTAPLTEENKILKDDLAKSLDEVAALKAQIIKLEKDLEAKKEATERSKDIKEKIQTFEKEKVSAKGQVSDLMKKIKQIQTDIHTKEQNYQIESQKLNEQLQQARSQEKRLVEDNLNLKEKLDMQTDIVTDLDKTIQKLQEENREQDASKSSIAKINDRVAELESSCSNLKAELKSKKEEIRQSYAKQADLFKKIKDRENMCDMLEKKLSATEEQAKQEKMHWQNNSKKDLEQAKSTIDELTKSKEELLTENMKLKEQVASCEQKQKHRTTVAGKEKELSEKLRELSMKLEEMKEREKLIQKHNYEIKKTLDAKDLQQEKLEEEVKVLNLKLEAKKGEDNEAISSMDALKKEAEDWQRKFDDLTSTLSDTEANIEMIAKRSAAKEKDLEAQKQHIKEELETAKFKLKEKEAELLLMQKRSENNELLSKMVDERAEELKAKNQSIQQLDKENKKLVDETKKLERVVTELKRKTKELETDNNEMKQEKGVFEKQLEKQKTTSRILKNTENDLEKAYDKIHELKSEKKELLLKCEQLQTTLSQMENHQTVETENTKENLAKKESSSSSYESDFEEDSQSSEESNNDERTKSVKYCASDKEKSAEKSSEKEDVTFGDDDAFLDMSEEIMEFQGEYNVTEDITVEEDYLANHLDEYDYVEAIEPLEEDEKQEKKLGDTPVKDCTAEKNTNEVNPHENHAAKRGHGRKEEQKE
ncbi:golgin subfamily A member 4-like, partial [Rhopilema esculentum]|uniref:golgin subfamily A member 4-like n=1 Tax=Rhopilema esculentum TaxID=499914 RepID=UPI0031CFC894|eukprot:gene2494-20044_t